MLFNSLAYLLFLPIVCLMYFIVPNKLRHSLLLVASYYFYMSWKKEYIVLIVFTTLISYFFARSMQFTSNKNGKKTLLILALLINFLVLFVFKYASFFLTITNYIMPFKIDNPTFTEKYLMLPVGISFYTFQTVSYLIDVYKEKMKPERNIITFALYVTFFPQLVAGPIERAKHLIDELKKCREFSFINAISGFKMMLWGYFMKVVIADRIAYIIDKGFIDVDYFNGITWWIVIALFGVQIYCDFAGYSLIAIGSAKILGIHLMTNFKQPYFSSSLKDFWSRWHISLSTWFRDYVYIPLGGNKKGTARTIFNHISTFVLSGLWHGANFTFLIWGFLHGLLLIFEKFLNIKKLKVLRGIVTYCCVQLLWVFFRSKSVSDAFIIIKKLFNIMSYKIDLHTSKYHVLILILSLIILFIYDLMKEKLFLLKENLILQKVFIVIGIMFIVAFGYYANQEFIYFQF